MAGDGVTYIGHATTLIEVGGTRLLTDPVLVSRIGRPRIVVPVHWGTLARPWVWWRADPAAPARRFAELVAVHAPEVEARILAPGERLAIGEVPA